MSLGNSKVELKLEWTKHCFLFVLCNGNRNYNSDINIFNTKETKILVCYHQFISKTQSKTFKTSKQRVWKVCVWDEYQTKNEKQKTSIDIFSNQVLQELTDCLIWFTQTNITTQKGVKLKDNFYQKVLSMSSSVERMFMINPLILV